jgi:hypothetical protein
MRDSGSAKQGWLVAGSRHLLIRAVDAAIGAIVGAIVAKVIEKRVPSARPRDTQGAT